MNGFITKMRFMTYIPGVPGSKNRQLLTLSTNRSRMLKAFVLRVKISHEIATQSLSMDVVYMFSPSSFLFVETISELIV